MLGISSSCVNANSPYERGMQIEPSQTVFQSTHPVRGATGACRPVCRKDTNFNPRTPHGVRLDIFFLLFHRPYISTHAPLTGCDAIHVGRNPQASDFNPRTPHGVRLGSGRFRRCGPYFNPRTPHGVRRPSGLYRYASGDFNPRTPHGVRLGVLCDLYHKKTISTHAPLTGCDLSSVHDTT